MCPQVHAPLFRRRSINHICGLWGTSKGGRAKADIPRVFKGAPPHTKARSWDVRFRWPHTKFYVLVGPQLGPPAVKRWGHRGGGGPHRAPRNFPRPTFFSHPHRWQKPAVAGGSQGDGKWNCLTGAPAPGPAATHFFGGRGDMTPSYEEVQKGKVIFPAPPNSGFFWATDQPFLRLSAGGTAFPPRFSAFWAGSKDSGRL